MLHKEKKNEFYLIWTPIRRSLILLQQGRNNFCFIGKESKEHGDDVEYDMAHLMNYFLAFPVEAIQYSYDL